MPILEVLPILEVPVDSPVDSPMPARPGVFRLYGCMGRLPRHFRPHTLIEVTTRTIHGRLLMRPSPVFNEIFLGVLGYAQAAYGMEIQTYVAMSNHYHLHCRPEDPGHLRDFMRLFNSKLAREVGRLHDWRDKVWSRRFQPIPISDEPAAQIARLKYVLSHGVKEGLVASPLDWPGAHCAGPLLTGRSPEGLWFNRTLEFAANRRGLEFGARDFATVETVTLSPLPCWEDLSPQEYRQRIAELIAEIEREGRVLAAGTGREPAGVAWVRRQNPHERPMHRSKRSPAPTIHAATRAVRRVFREALRIFLAAYRASSERFRGGDLDVQFPECCFPPPRPFSRGSPPVFA